MTTRHNTNLAVIKEQARTWVSLFERDNVSTKEQAKFQEWVSASPHHVREFCKAEQVWKDLSLIENYGQDVEAVEFVHSISSRAKTVWQKTTNKTSTSNTPVSRPFRLSLIAASFLAAIAIISLFLLEEPNQRTSYSTEYAEHKNIALEDGSHVSLSARTQFQTSFSGSVRRASLISGEAFFDIAKDSERPFIITVGTTEILVTGTQFDVHRAGKTIRVAVTEGKVEVTQNNGNDKVNERRFLRANQHIVATENGNISDVLPITGDKPGAWRSGRLSYTQHPLYSLVSDLNRYYMPGVTVMDKSLNSIEITTSFKIEQIEQMMAALAASNPVQVEKTAKGRFIIKAITAPDVPTGK